MRTQFLAPTMNTDPYACEGATLWRVDVVLLETALGGRPVRRKALKGEELLKTKEAAEDEAADLLRAIIQGEHSFPEGSYEIQIIEGEFDQGADCGDGSFDSEFYENDVEAWVRFRAIKKIQVEVL